MHPLVKILVVCLFFGKRNDGLLFWEVWNVVYDPNKPVVMAT